MDNQAHVKTKFKVLFNVNFQVGFFNLSQLTLQKQVLLFFYLRFFLLLLSQDQL